MRSLAIALLLLSGSAVCQDCRKAAAQLRSDSLSEQAWGAQLATDCDNLAPQIAEKLEQPKPALDSPQFWTAHALLDTLIRLRAPLKESTLASIVKNFPTEGTILLLQHAFASRALLAQVRIDHPGSAEWIAASNALAILRAEGFAATLLHEIKLTHSAWISDTGAAPGRGFGGSLGSGSPTFNVPPGFPPIALYRLTALPKDGDELVSDGATPIYSQRILIAPGAPRELRWTPEGHCVQCLEIGYLSDLAYSPRSTIEQAVEPQTPMKWSTLARLNSDLTRALTDQVLAMKDLAKSLVSSGALNPSELPMSLQIEVRLEDQRTDHSQPLPSIPPFKFVLE